MAQHLSRLHQTENSATTCTATCRARGVLHKSLSRMHMRIFLSTRWARQMPVCTHERLKNRPGHTGLWLPYYILACPMWEHQVLVTLEAEGEVNIARYEVRAPHFPCCSGPVADRLFLRPQGTFQWANLTMPKVKVPGECGPGVHSHTERQQQRNLSYGCF